MNGINIITCYTLIDITHTGVVRYSNSPDNMKKRNQQRNYETLLQVIGLRAQPMLFEKPYVLRYEDLRHYNFGSLYDGEHTVWVLKFSIEQPEVFKEGDNYFGLLEQDINQVPIISGLDETVDLPVTIFSSAYDYKNTYFTNSR